MKLRNLNIFWVVYHLHCGLWEERLCWYVPGYKIWPFDSSRSRWIKAQKTGITEGGKKWAGSSNERLWNKGPAAAAEQEEMKSDKTERNMWKSRVKSWRWRIKWCSWRTTIMILILIEKGKEIRVNFCWTTTTSSWPISVPTLEADSECLRWNQASSHIKRTQRVWSVSRFTIFRWFSRWKNLHGA